MPSDPEHDSDAGESRELPSPEPTFEEPIEESEPEVEPEAGAEQGESREESGPGPASSVHDALTVQRALASGIPQEMMDRLSPGGLQHLVQQAEMARLQNMARAGYGPGLPPIPGYGPGYGAVHQQPPSASARKLELKLDPEDWEQPTIDVLTRIRDHYDQRLAEMEQIVGVMMGGLREREQQMQQAEFDAYVQGLGPEWEAILGKGPTSSLDMGSPQFQARNLIYMQGNSIGQAVGSRRGGWDMARSSVFAQSGAVAARTELAGKVKKFGQQAVSRPSGRRAEHTKGDPVKRATAAVAQKLRKLGVTEEY
jgi:hypothetical protein